MMFDGALVCHRLAILPGILASSPLFVDPSIQDDEGKNCLHTAFSVESDGEVVKELVDAPW